ncbi:MAG: phosphoribosylanthranilate isomerase, partial [Acidimicrobiales bacterium]
DALFAVAMGADAVGFIFASGSSRQISVTQARDIARRLPPEVMTVGVFRDEAPQRVVEMVNTAGLHAVQLHGHETPAEGAWIRQRVQFLIQAFSAGDRMLDRVDEYTAADAILIDSAAGGGSGQVFDWVLAEGLPLDRRVILAGGLTPENVGDAVRRVHPWGVDVSTGVEVRPGKKDGSKVRRFINAANEAAAEDDPDGLLDDPVTAFAGSPSATQLLAVAKTDEVEAAFYDWDDDSTSA